MKFTLVSFLILNLSNSAFSLKCYQCDIAQGKDLSCDHPKEVVCGKGLTMCIKISVFHQGIKAVSKSCVPKCNPMKYSTNILGVESKFDCCQGNLCNGSETVLKNKYFHSVITIFAILKVFL